MGLMFGRRRPIARLAVGALTAGPAGTVGPAGTAGTASEASRYPAPPSSAYVAPQPASTGGEVDELGHLVQMHGAGALTDEEFAAAKAQLLGI
jgi:hypothetical protein